MDCNSWNKSLHAYGSFQRRDFGLRFAQRARVPAGDVVLESEQAALGADLRFELIGRDHQTLQDKLRCAITDEAIAFHLAEPQTTVAGSTFGGLAREDDARTARARACILS